MSQSQQCKKMFDAKLVFAALKRVGCRSKLDRFLAECHTGALSIGFRLGQYAQTTR